MHLDAGRPTMRTHTREVLALQSLSLPARGSLEADCSLGCMCAPVVWGCRALAKPGMVQVHETWTDLLGTNPCTADM